MGNAEKRLLRQRIREGCPGEAARRKESAALCRHILSWDGYLRAGVIGAYVPIRMEADILPVIGDALRRGKQLALPRVEDRERMTLRLVRSLEDMKPGRWNIPEPGEDAEIVEPGALELLIVPLEGIDRQGVRLGKGGGYYDRLLEHVSCPVLGAVMSWQWQERICPEPWDQPLQAAADQNGIHLF